jgi:hypothetical protein
MCQAFILVPADPWPYVPLIVRLNFVEFGSQN